jgi:haloalkane dehalogenase
VEGIGPAGHQAPEDRPDEIGRAISRWLDRHRLTCLTREAASAK